MGYKTFFLTGTDENAIKNAKKAKELGMTAQELVDKNAQRFFNLKTLLNLSFDNFIRTTSTQHIKGAQKFWELCKKDIYKKKYSGLYCVGCESFYKDGEFENNVCPYHNKPLEKVEEENYFFALSRYQNKLLEIYEKGEIKIVPEFRKKEVVKFIEKGLEDFSISRPKERTYNWGIDVPGDPSQKIYVWFDALVNYLTGLSFSEDSKTYQEFWLENNNKIHIIGKDIIKFHLIYWPAMLLSAGLPLPNKVFVHGFLTLNKKKMSKTLGNVVYPEELVEKYGIGATRYYFLREVVSWDDGDFSYERMNDIYSSELSNELGNLISRVTNLAQKDRIKTHFPEVPFKDLMPKEFYQHVESFELHLALELIREKIKKLNKMMDKEAPWRKKPEERKDFLEEMLFELYKIGKALQPFMPETGKTIEQSCLDQIKKVKPLFPRLK